MLKKAQTIIRANKPDMFKKLPASISLVTILAEKQEDESLKLRVIYFVRRRNITDFEIMYFKNGVLSAVNSKADMMIFDDQPTVEEIFIMLAGVMKK